MAWCIDGTRRQGECLGLGGTHGAEAEGMSAGRGPLLSEARRKGCLLIDANKIDGGGRAGAAGQTDSTDGRRIFARTNGGQI